MVHIPGPGAGADPDPGPDFDDWDDDQFLSEDDFSDLDEEELDLIQEMREAAANEWLVPQEWLDEDDTRDQPDG